VTRTRHVVAVGIDAAPESLIDTWIEQGHLPELAALRQRSARALLRGCEAYRAETPWTCILTGCEPEQTGYWSSLRFQSTNYGIDDRGAYDFAEYPPFYALNGDYGVVAFDLPQARIHDAVNGVQVVSWGAHSPLAPRASRPAELLPDIERRFGTHPALLHDQATLWRPREQARLERQLTAGIDRRASICAYLMERQPWHLFLTAFGETHSAGHYQWHFSQPNHPLSGRCRSGDGDPLLRVYQRIDLAIGRIRAGAPPDSCFVVFSQEGMEPNCMDLPSMVFLPELLYRLSFRARRGLGAASTEFGDVALPSRSWVPALWGTQSLSSPLRRLIRTRLPSALAYRIDALWSRKETEPLPPCEAGEMPYQPATWYRHLWPRMRAFALPSFAEGYVRLNVRGREADGIVDNADYDRVCNELIAEIAALKDAHSGKPIVREVRRTRSTALDDSMKLPDADLIVLWSPIPTDTVDSPTAGRIGPVPFYRSGSHTEQGFAWISGPGIEATRLPDGRPASLAPTLLTLLGARAPGYMKQPSLVPSPT
jgi:predicted AlkP superfamily phosphohydrolase/phosphomutase